MITTVFIDVDDTLLDFGKSAHQAVQKLFDEKGLPFSDEVMTVYHSVCTPLWEAVERGELTAAQLRKIRWNCVFEKLGINRTDGERFESDYRKHLADTGFLIPNADKLLEYLSRKYTVCIVSNAGFEQQNARLEKAGLKQYVDYIFTSQEIGHEKPEKAFFDFCLKAVGNPSASEVMVIGDSAVADIAGGKKMGFQTCWFNPNGKSNAQAGADFHVCALLDILDIL